MLFIPNFEYVYYPDVLIILGEHRFHYHKKIEATLNPDIIIEVFSENYNLTYRWRAFQSIESLKQYVLISQQLPFVEKFEKKSGSDQWLYDSFSNMNSEVTIGNRALALKDIYTKVKF